MKLTELMGLRGSKDQPYALEIQRDGNARFVTDSGNTYEIHFYPVRDQFHREIPGATQVTFSLAYDPEGEEVDSMGIEATGNLAESARIFTTVLTACRKYDQRYHPLVWTFSAMETSRKKLYRTLSRRLAKELGLDLRVKEADVLETYILARPNFDIDSFLKTVKFEK